MSKKVCSLLSVLVLLASVVAGCATPEPTPAPLTPTTQAQPTATPEPTSPPAAEPAEPQKLILATTTSTQDSGLLDYILPDYQDAYNVQIEVVAVGTGQAITLGEDGNADVLLVHARAKEDAFMADGHGVRREDVMYNDFVIVGPASDPAGIQGMKKATRALEEIAKAGAPFVSRGDDSGTHTKEKAVWKEAGIEPAGDWYISAGQGMGAVLTMADEQLAYTLSDRATYLARTLEGTDLVILVEGDPVLFNPYGVIAVNPDKSPQINNTLANQFIDWLISLPTQAKIAEFGVAEFGDSLFIPDSTAWREAQGGAAEASGAALKISGGAKEMSWTEAELKAMGTLDVDYAGKDGTVTTYTGVLMSSLLEMAGAGEGATLVLVASDGYSAEIALADVLACANCIVAFDPEGGLRSVLPDQSGKLQIKGLVEIQIQGGAPAEAPAGGIPEGAALKITGSVNAEIGWLEEDVRAMDTMEAQSTNKSGETSTYTGVLINTLLEMAGPKADATTVVFVADDGYSAEAPLADVLACADCIVSFRNQGGFSIVMPGFASSLQVKGVVEIQVK
ncbi:MAG: substrate-binding domain-containing protein [Chloroflexota bacterium]